MSNLTSLLASLLVEEGKRDLSVAVVLGFLCGAKVITPGTSRGWASPEGLRSPLPFGHEGMRRSNVHAAGVLRMKPAAVYHIAN